MLISSFFHEACYDRRTTVWQNICLTDRASRQNNYPILLEISTLSCLTISSVLFPPWDCWPGLGFHFVSKSVPSIKVLNHFKPLPPGSPINRQWRPALSCFSKSSNKRTQQQSTIRYFWKWHDVGSRFKKSFLTETAAHDICLFLYFGENFTRC